MAKQKIQFFYVDNTYVEYLKKVDSKVPNMVYDSNRKFVCGIVLAINGYKYYAPVSSNTTKNITKIRISYSKQKKLWQKKRRQRRPL